MYIAVFWFFFENNLIRLTHCFNYRRLIFKIVISFIFIFKEDFLLLLHHNHLFFNSLLLPLLEKLCLLHKAFSSFFHPLFMGFFEFFFEFIKFWTYEILKVLAFFHLESNYLFFSLEFLLKLFLFNLVILIYFEIF